MKSDMKSEWVSDAYGAVVSVAARLEKFTTDDVWEELRVRGVKILSVDPRDLGPVMRLAASRNICKNSGTYRASKRRSRHGGTVAIWKSI